MEARSKKLALRLFVSIVASVFCSFASSAPLRIAPVRVFVDDAARTGVVTLTNPADTPMSIQVDAYSWRQSADGADEYEPTIEIVAFPPIFTIQPGESQLVRIGRLSESLTDRESTYRVYFTELPQPQELDNTQAGLRMRLRVGVPVFSAPSIARRPELRVTSSEFLEDGLRVRLHNSGNTHIRVSELSTHEILDSEPLASLRYILPGASQEFTIPVPAGALVSAIQAVTEQLGATQYDLETGLAITAPEAELASR